MMVSIGLLIGQYLRFFNFFFSYLFDFWLSLKKKINKSSDFLINFNIFNKKYEKPQKISYFALFSTYNDYFS